ncbi:helix-turn-helix domain-containing protein [Streptomyces heilongjiangensis]|uniref:Helix-turn-helix domain-containing protein n=1 Tax=Streptomyces heilongjiangensis TaxID=945052 RepID=A0ABW1B4D4_9ACTN|nr:helix-turn-helix transcriptional regulator [Streptomyces heilongjiangensis]MDC2951758.1 helix-turn-helix transcriptional regulator [Streptomyces heilongjiangensis]
MAISESGPTSTQVAQNIERVRKARQLKQKDVSDRLRAVGRPMLPTVVSKVERGDRRVDVDDLVAFALALNVSPLALLLPPVPIGDWATVRLTADVEALIADAWAWAAGEQALPDEPGDRPDSAKQEAYEQLTLSKRRRYLKSRPASREAEALHAEVDRVVEVSEFTLSGDQERFRNRMAAARRSLSRLAAELDRVEAEHEELERSLEESKARRQGSAGSEDG